MRGDETKEEILLAWAQSDNEIEQILGKALGYPWYVDDPVSFPEATEEDGVCAGEHTAVTLAMEAAGVLRKVLTTSRRR